MARRIEWATALLIAWIAAAFQSPAPRATEKTSLAAIPAAAATTTDAWIIPVSDDQAVVDLTTAHDAQYELIISSLARPGRPVRVELESVTSPASAVAPLLPVSPLSRQTAACKRSPANLPAANPSCRHPHTAADEPEVLISATRRRFFLHVATTPLEDAGGYRAITGELLSEGREVRVYVDADFPRDQLAPELAAAIIQLLDERLIPRGREFLGDWSDIDEDGKLAVLITPWLGRLRGGQTSIDGCVRANDFQKRVEAPFGNAADVLYLNAQLEPGPRLETVLAHEYTHVIGFSQRLGGKQGPLAMEEDWLNEALAHVAENLFETGWTNLEERITRYLGAPAQSPLTVVDYYRAGLWRDPGCRGAAYLFLRYCVDQFGPDLLHDLIQNPLTGSRNLEQTTGTPFATLFRHWTIALARGDAVPGVSSEHEGPRCVREPHRILWPHDETRHTLELEGTTAAFINVPNIQARGGRIRISGTPAGRLQVTLIRHPKTTVATEDSCLTSP